MALVLAPFAWVLMPWLVRVVLGRVHPCHGRRPNTPPRRVHSARARVDEVVPRLDRQARSADHRPLGGDRRRCSRSWILLGDGVGRDGRRHGDAARHDRLWRRLGGAALPAAPRPPRQARDEAGCPVKSSSSPGSGRPMSAGRRAMRPTWPSSCGPPGIASRSSSRRPRHRPRSRIPFTGRGGSVPSASGTSIPPAESAWRARHVDAVYTTGMFAPLRHRRRRGAAAVRDEAHGRPGVRAPPGPRRRRRRHRRLPAEPRQQ